MGLKEVILTSTVNTDCEGPIDIRTSLHPSRILHRLNRLAVAHYVGRKKLKMKRGIKQTYNHG